MKKIFALLLLAALLCGCSPSGIGGSTAIHPGESGSDMEGISLSILSTGDTLTAQWENETQWDVIYGAGYDIQRLEGGNWVSCRKEDFAVISIAYILAPGDKQEQCYDPGFFDLSQAGTYRLVCTYSVDNDDKSLDNCTVWAEFTVAHEVVTQPQELDFSAQYIRTNGGMEDASYPIITKISSAAELNAYYEENKDRFDLEHRETVYSDTSIGFIDACERYDDAYFQSHDLILVLLEEGSGSIRHEVTSVQKDAEGDVNIHINTIVPEVGTCDMAQWHIMVELEKQDGSISVSIGSVQAVSLQYGDANMSLRLPEGWEYEYVTGAEGSESFGIRLWPAGEDEGALYLQYSSLFGVCGTDLSTKDVTIAGRNATQGTYSGDTPWSYIHFKDITGDYVVLNEGAGAWWDRYSEEAMKILESIGIG